MVALRAEGRPLRTVVEALAAKGHRLSVQGVANIVKAAGAREAA